VKTVRILLNSKSAQFPEGLANSSGKVGRYLMDTVGSSVSGQVPLLESLPAAKRGWGKRARVLCALVAVSRPAKRQAGLRRAGYHIEFGGGPAHAGFRHVARPRTLYPAAATARSSRMTHGRYYGSFVGFDGRGEMIPNEKSYCEIDPKVKGPVGAYRCCAFHWQWSDHETRQAAHMQKNLCGDH